MPFPVSVLLEGIAYTNGLVAQVLVVHGLKGGISGLEGIKGDESESTTCIRSRIPRYRRCSDDGPKAPKRVIQQFSSASGAKFPTNKFAPMSRVRLSAEARLTLMGLPHSLT